MTFQTKNINQGQKKIIALPKALEHANKPRVHKDKDMKGKASTSIKRTSEKRRDIRNFYRENHTVCDMSIYNEMLFIVLL